MRPRRGFTSRLKQLFAEVAEHAHIVSPVIISPTTSVIPDDHLCNNSAMSRPSSMVLRWILRSVSRHSCQMAVQKEHLGDSGCAGPRPGKSVRTVLDSAHGCNRIRAANSSYDTDLYTSWPATFHLVASNCGIRTACQFPCERPNQRYIEVVRRCAYAGARLAWKPSGREYLAEYLRKDRVRARMAGKTPS